MIVTIEDMAKCKRCGSDNTSAEMLIPSMKPHELRGKNEDQMVEIACKDCGKINRTKVKVDIE